MSRTVIGGRPTTRRTFDEIAASIISACAQGRRKTSIMHAAALNTGQANMYLAILVGKNLLVKETDDRTYSSTHRGREYLRVFKGYDQTMDLLLEQRKALDAFLEGPNYPDLPDESVVLDRSPATTSKSVRPAIALISLEDDNPL